MMMVHFSNNSVIKPCSVRVVVMHPVMIESTVSLSANLNSF